MEIRVADYIIDYIYKNGTDTIFTIAGGGAMFLNDAVVLHKKIRYICNHHEQACAMAAEAYAKLKNRIGAVMVTSGPGSTNAITGLMEAYQNSIPVLFISSQAKKSQMIAFSGVPDLRQFGIQEIDIIPVVKSLTKYAAIVDKSEDIRYHLQKAYYFALSDRPGPVWLDIPPDIASSQLPQRLLSFSPPKKAENELTGKKLHEIASLIHKSQKPLIIAGGGIKLSGAREIFRAFIQKAKIPVVTPDMGIDLFEYDNPFYVGHGGTKGDRAANIAIQQSDFILSLGSRLAVPFIGHEYDTWAPNAYKIVVDVDWKEHKKKTIKINLFIKSNVKEFIKKIYPLMEKRSVKEKWIKKCQFIKSTYALKNVTPTTDKTDEINMYDAIKEISKQSKPYDVFITDAGTTAYVSTQTIKIKKNQRMILPGATLTMGYNLPALIGVWAAHPKAGIICITGDGSFQMNIHELATISHHKIPAKIFVINNQGYLAIRTTQKNFFNGRLIGEGKKTGISFPNMKSVSDAYGMRYFEARKKIQLHTVIKEVLRCDGPVLCNLIVPYWQDILTVSSKKLKNGKLVSMPIDDMYPYLSQKEIDKIRETT